MYSINPRYSDDFGFYRLVEQLFDPCGDYRREPSLIKAAAISNAARESEVQNTDREFRIRLDLHHYKPEEVKISSDNDSITVKAMHEEKQDNHGYVSREMTRIYKLPADVDVKSVTSTMNAQGILMIKAQKLAVEQPKETPIPVEFKKE